MYGVGGLVEDVAGVHFFVDVDDGDTGLGVAVGDGPLDGGSSSVFGKKRGVKVDGFVGGEVDDGGGNVLAVGDDDDEVGFECGQLAGGISNFFGGEGWEVLVLGVGF